MTNLFTTTLNASVKNQGTVNEDAELFYQFSKIPLIYIYISANAVENSIYTLPT